MTEALTDEKVISHIITETDYEVTGFIIGTETTTRTIPGTRSLNTVLLWHQSPSDPETHSILVILPPDASNDIDNMAIHSEISFRGKLFASLDERLRPINETLLVKGIGQRSREPLTKRLTILY